MRDVNVGMVGLGTVGGSTLRVLDENASEIKRRLGFSLRVRAAASLEIEARSEQNGRLLTRSWQEVVEHPEVEIVVELIGGKTVAQQAIRAALELGADAIELHTGEYANATGADRIHELDRLDRAASLASKLELAVHAGHGLTYENVGPVASIPKIEELNIGHSVIARAVLVGMERAVKDMSRILRRARRARA